MRTISLGLLLLALSPACSNEKKGFSGKQPVATAESDDQSAAEEALAPELPPLTLPGEEATVDVPEVPENAIVIGSFTLFTNPADPAPGEDYSINVKVSLPKQETAYQASDLYVHVLGTDGYEMLFSGGQAHFIGTLAPFEKAPVGYMAEPHPLDASKQVIRDRKTYQFTTQTTDKTEAYFSIQIPGGANAVKDAISVKSTLLKESQSAVLEF